MSLLLWYLHATDAMVTTCLAVTIITYMSLLLNLNEYIFLNKYIYYYYYYYYYYKFITSWVAEYEMQLDPCDYPLYKGAL